MLHDPHGINEDDLDRAIAVKYESLRFKAEFFPFRFDMFEGDASTDKLDFCNSLGSACVSPGFTTCQLDCESVGCEDAPVCNQRRLENEEAGGNHTFRADEAQERPFQLADELTEVMEGLKKDMLSASQAENEAEEEVPAANADDDGPTTMDDEMAEVIDSMKDILFDGDDDEEKEMWGELEQISVALNLPADGEGGEGLSEDILAT